MKSIINKTIKSLAYMNFSVSVINLLNLGKFLVNYKKFK